MKYEICIIWIVEKWVIANSWRLGRALLFYFTFIYFPKSGNVKMKWAKLFMSVYFFVWFFMSIRHVLINLNEMKEPKKVNFGNWREQGNSDGEVICNMRVIIIWTTKQYSLHKKCLTLMFYTDRSYENKIILINFYFYFI